MQTKIVTAALAVSSLFAQDQVRIVTAVPATPMTVDVIGPTGIAMGGRSIKGLPYSAEAVNETSRTLPDGNKISRKTSSAVYRDSQGRTRNEMPMPAVGPWASGKGEKIVNIFDPVAKVSIMLHPNNTANKHEIPSMENMNVTETTTATSGGQLRTMVFARRAEGNREGAPGEKKRVIEDVVIERMHGPELDTAIGPAIAVSGMAMPGMSAGNRNFRKESLGKKVIEGVEAEGSKTVSIIPAGEIGNERDIEIIDETWFSKEIEALVYSRHSDPQTGETTYRLTNIQRGEQPQHLFEVPADYKLNSSDFKMMEDGPRRMEIKMRTKAPGNE